MRWLPTLFPLPDHKPHTLSISLLLFVSSYTSRKPERSRHTLPCIFSGDFVWNNCSPRRRSGAKVVHIFCYNWPGLWDFSVMMYPRVLHDGKTLVIPPPAEPNGQDQVGQGLGKKRKQYWQISNHSRKWQAAGAASGLSGLGRNPLTSCSNSVIFQWDGREEGGGEQIA